MVGKRHYEVAKILKDIPKGTTFTIRLVEPLKSGFASIGPKTSGAKSGRKQNNYGSGKETLRFKANGQATIENDVSYHTYHNVLKVFISTPFAMALENSLKVCFYYKVYSHFVIKVQCMYIVLYLTDYHSLVFFTCD